MQIRGRIGVSVLRSIGVTYEAQMVHRMPLSQCCVFSTILPVTLTKEVERERCHVVGSIFRETIGRVAAGAVAKKLLKAYSGTEILAYVSQAHNVILTEDLVDHETLTLDQVESNIARCPHPEYAEKMIAAIDAV